MLEMPFLVTSWDEANRMLNSKAYRDVLQEAEKATGVIIYGDLPYGFRNVANNKHPISKLEDFRGLKLRVINSSMQIAVWRALGANPVGMPWGRSLPSDAERRDRRS